jgi:hypothetical protein
MLHSVACPVCGTLRLKPPFAPSIRKVAWSDECACSDDTLCLRHRFSDEPIPKRPSPEALVAKAEMQYAEELKEYAAEKLKFAKHSAAGADVEADLAFNELQKTMGAPVPPERRLRRQADVDEAYRRGAEKMREEIALLFDGGPNVAGLATMPAWRDFIRELAIPEDKP